jgi:hypothetical protein
MEEKAILGHVKGKLYIGNTAVLRQHARLASVNIGIIITCGNELEATQLAGKSRLCLVDSGFVEDSFASFDNVRITERLQAFKNEIKFYLEQSENVLICSETGCNLAAFIASFLVAIGDPTWEKTQDKSEIFKNAITAVENAYTSDPAAPAPNRVFTNSSMRAFLIPKKVSIIDSLKGRAC